MRAMKMTKENPSNKWDEYGNLPSRLPDDLHVHHAELSAWATERARGLGWVRPTTKTNENGHRTA